MIKWFVPRKPKQIKLVAEFQEDRPPRPLDAHEGLVSTQERGYRDARVYDPYARNPLACPSCNTTVYMKHGDRVLCKCGVYIETYGNGLYWWKADLSNTSTLFTTYPRLNPGDVDLSIYEQLTVSDRISEIAEAHPAVKDALQEVETLIKLHESVDITD